MAGGFLSLSTTADLGGAAGVARLLPIACTNATFAAATLGTPSSTGQHTYSLYRAPASNLSTAGMQAVSGLTCTLTATNRTCTTNAAVSFSVGDAFTLIYSNTEGIAAQNPDGGHAIYFRCN